MRIFFAAAALGLISLSACSTAPRYVERPIARVAPAAQPMRYRWTHGNASKAHQDALNLFGTTSLAPGDYRWLTALPDGETKVVIDLLTQKFYVYRGEQLVGMSTISSGKKGKETQLGFWAVRVKKVKGFSRKYDNAPMPYMQMYDEKGLAFHAGALPGYPASHGCVRLPMKFAEKVYGLTKIGTKVIIEG